MSFRQYFIYLNRIIYYNSNIFSPLIFPKIEGKNTVPNALRANNVA